MSTRRSARWPRPAMRSSNQDRDSLPTPKSKPVREKVECRGLLGSTSCAGSTTTVAAALHAPGRKLRRLLRPRPAVAGEVVLDHKQARSRAPPAQHVIDERDRSGCRSSVAARFSPAEKTELHRTSPGAPPLSDGVPVSTSAGCIIYPAFSATPLLLAQHRIASRIVSTALETGCRTEVQAGEPPIPMTGVGRGRPPSPRRLGRDVTGGAAARC